jgi:hypothetical protein
MPQARDLGRLLGAMVAVRCPSELAPLMRKAGGLWEARSGSRTMSDRTATTEARLEGFYWVILGRNPPEIAYWERGEWWLAGDPKPWHPEAVTVVSERLVFKPRMKPVP